MISYFIFQNQEVESLVVTQDYVLTPTEKKENIQEVC